MSTATTTGHQVRKTSTRLADGREIIYFDDSEPYVSGGATRRLDDPRPLADRFSATATNGEQHEVTAPEMRFDVLTGEWVPMASHRMNRTFLPPPEANPLAPARPGTSYSDGDIPAEDYDVVVFENRFPALVQMPGVPDEVTWLDGEALWPARPAAGRCEVICFSPDATASLATVGQHRMRTIIEAWADRTEELGNLAGIEQVFCFENRGQEIGVTLPHPHGQVYAYPYLTPRTATMLQRARQHRLETGNNLLADVLAAELRSARRIVATSDHWVAYVPAAARWPVELHVAPRRDVPDLPALTLAERADLADMYLALLQSADRFFTTRSTDGEEVGVPLPYVAAWHQAPVGEGRSDLRLFCQLFSTLRAPGKLKFLAGSESGMGAWVSDTTPEKIAERFREVIAWS